MKRSLWQESFVPLTLVVLAIFISLLFVRYEVAQDTDRAIVIVIEDNGQNIESPDSEEGVAVAVAANDPERAQIIALISNKNWPEAERVLKARLSKSISSEILTDLGSLYFQQKDYEQALQYLDKAIATKPVYSGAYFQRGLNYSKMGNFEKAADDYQQQIKLEPFHSEANYNLGVLQFKMKQYRAASQTFERATKLTSGKRKAKAFYNLGLTFNKLGKTHKEQARNAFNAAIRLRPAYIAPRFGLASLEPDNKKGHQNALKLYETVLRLQPNYAPVYFRMGLTYSSLGKTKAAINAYRQAIKYDPAYVKAHFNLGLKLIATKQWTEAAQQFEWMLQRDPQHAKSYFSLGRIAKAKKEYPAALKYYQTAISLRKGNYPEAIVNMGLIHFIQDQFDQAITDFNDAIRLHPNYAKAWYQLGLAQFHKGMMSEAKTSLHTAIKSDSGSYKAWAALGRIYAQENQIDDAVHAYQQALLIRSDYQSTQLALADIYHQQKRNTEALSLYKVLLDRYPNYGVAWAKVGVVYKAMGRHVKAENALKRAIELDPHDNESKRVLAQLMISLKQPKKAVKLLASAVENESGRPELYLEYAEALSAAGHASAARSELQKGLRLDPENPKLMKAMKLLDK